MNCPRCGKPAEAEWSYCPFCGTPVSRAEEAAGPPAEQAPSGARIELDGSVAKEISQDVEGGGASLTMTDSVARSVSQTVKGAGLPCGDEGAGESAVSGLANMALHDVVAKEIHQEVHFHVGSAEDLDGILTHSAASRLKARLVFVACGREIRAYNPRAAACAAPANVYTLPDAMGSARSVRLAKVDDRLLVLAGARCGVVAFDQQTAAARVYPFPRSTRHGANATAVLDGRLYATHSDFGLLEWPLDGGEPTSLFTNVFGPARTVRGVQVTPKRDVILCAGTSAYRFDPSNPDVGLVEYKAPAGANLVGVAHCGEYLYAAAITGRVFRWLAALPSSRETVLADAHAKAYCMSLVQMRRGPRLVLGSKCGFVRVVDLKPPQATAHYHAPGGTRIRWARGAPDLVVASDNACRVIYFWDSDRPQQPHADVVVAKLGRDLVMDIAVLSM